VLERFPGAKIVGVTQTAAETDADAPGEPDIVEDEDL
jgi:hypothetical protein